MKTLVQVMRKDASYRALLLDIWCLSVIRLRVHQLAQDMCLHVML